MEGRFQFILSVSGLVLFLVAFISFLVVDEHSIESRLTISIVYGVISSGLAILFMGVAVLLDCILRSRYEKREEKEHGK